MEKSKFNAIRVEFLKGTFNQADLCRRLHVSKNTMTKYVKECREIQHLYPKRLRDPAFRLPEIKRIIPPTAKYQTLISMLPALIDAATTARLWPLHLWEDYRKICLQGYGLHWFGVHFLNWRRKTNLCLYSHRRVMSVSTEDREVFQKWTHSFDHKKWERATVVIGSHAGRPLKAMASSLNRTTKSLLRWIDNYKAQGIAGLIDAPYTTNSDLLDKVKEKQERVVKLLHETPHAYGLNRASWSLETIALIYQRVHGEPMCDSTVWSLLDKAGYGFRKSREMLTSPDLKFREKLDHIKNILANLGPNERFFSVDEYGHFSVKVKGGKSYALKNQHRTVESNQVSKGYLIVTAALELSANQVTHFYSRHKNTDEMIKLLEVLLSQYKTADKLYFSWDCASWHASKKLYKKLGEVNADTYRLVHHTPLVELAPLPATAQFLNVIESVFSGLAKAVIHNSDYDSMEACMAAIDRHFLERNLHFQQYPQRAGKTIWGGEVVRPVFNESNNCKKPPGKVKPIG